MNDTERYKPGDAVAYFDCRQCGKSNYQFYYISEEVAEAANKQTGIEAFIGLGCPMICAYCENETANMPREPTEREVEIHAGPLAVKGLMRERGEDPG